MIERSRFLIRTVHWLESFPDIKEDATKRGMPVGVTSYHAPYRQL
jgi:hypothetical protein